MNKKLLIKFFPILVIVLIILGGYFLLFTNNNGSLEKTIIEPGDSKTIKDTGKIRIVSNEEPPTSYYSEDGEFVGTTVDIVNKIKENLNLDTEIEVMSWARAYSIAKEDPNVVIFTAGRTDERIGLGFSFVGPVVSRKHSLWAKKGSNFDISSAEDIEEQNLTIGAMRGDWREKYFLDLGFDIDEVTSHRQNLEKLLDGRIDLWVSSDIEVPRITKELGVEMDEIEMAYVFKEAASYIMFSDGTSEEIIEQWGEALEEIQGTDFFEDMSKKWSKILGSEVGYEEEIGFFVR